MGQGMRSVARTGKDIGKVRASARPGQGGARTTLNSMLTARTLRKRTQKTVWKYYRAIFCKYVLASACPAHTGGVQLVLPFGLRNAKAIVSEKNVDCKVPKALNHQLCHGTGTYDAWNEK